MLILSIYFAIDINSILTATKTCVWIYSEYFFFAIVTPHGYLFL